MYLITEIHTNDVIGLSEECRSDDEFQVIDNLMSRYKPEGEEETKEEQEGGNVKKYSPYIHT